ncbi:MAG: helix-hairpin-helix domain-containing protein [Methylomonas sp.]|jgi:DNA ligase (NAD+)|uniref:BRCT domain-containing protein n=1 Tax=Methylomonas sp. TaxID=418 RepID=UPI0025FF67B6|nr:BRCT domain-containing protein [Methylomonas sp.]MCK9607143.1 helix-hairpin-helix domain-containing protein [Methylomonas sp.]
MLTTPQKNLIAQASLSFDALSEHRFCQLCNDPGSILTASDSELTAFLQYANALYRGGEPIISDADYDFIYLAELKKRNPRHPLLQVVEPEPVFAGKTVDLPAIMLSTDKAYTFEDVERWAVRIEKAAQELGKNFAELTFKVTPKLDGYAAYDDGEMLYTRGDGRKGQDISRVFDRGLQIADHGRRGLGAGEIVVSRSYFDAHLAAYFDNARNFQASVIKEKELDEHAESAIKDHAAVFYPFAILPSWLGAWETLSSDFENIVKSIWHKVDYDVDGVILEIVDEELKSHMGATRHHHRWQLAYKENLQTAEVEVLSVTPQTSRSGRITPVAELEPVRLSGALLSRATAHHYKMVLDKGIGPGAIIQLARSGEVIPKIEHVIRPAEPQVPERCPSCNHTLIWDNDYLICPNNLACPAQISNSMEHFFRVLKNNDGFGAASIKKLYEYGIRRVDEIYALSAEQFESMGFGPKQSQNLVDQLLRSRTEAVEDWRFLAAFGVFRMGLGNCERLLSHHALTDIFSLSEDDIVAIEGFAEKTATVITEGFKTIKPLFDKLMALGFNLRSTQHQQDDLSHPLAGKTLVFTGTLHSGNRDDLSKQAKAKGAKIGSSVSAKTDYLVAGDNVGANKLNAARDKGVNIVSEQEFLQLLNGAGS